MTLRQATVVARKALAESNDIGTIRSALLDLIIAANVVLDIAVVIKETKHVPQKPSKVTYG